MSSRPRRSSSSPSNNKKESKKRSSILSHGTSSTIDSNLRETGPQERGTFFIPGITARARCLEKDSPTATSSSSSSKDLGDSHGRSRRSAADIYRKTATLMKENERETRLSSRLLDEKERSRETSRSPPPPSESLHSRGTRRRGAPYDRHPYGSSKLKTISTDPGSRRTSIGIKASANRNRREQSEAELQEAFDMFDAVVESIKTKRQEREGSMRQGTTTEEQNAAREQEEEQLHLMIKQLQVSSEKEDNLRDQVEMIRNLLSSQYGDQQEKPGPRKKKPEMAKSA